MDPTTPKAPATPASAPIRITIDPSRTVIEVEPTTETELRAAVRRVLALLEVSDDPQILPYWLYERRSQVLPAVAELRRLAGD